MSYTQIGEVIMRDSITGEPTGNKIPLYAKAKKKKVLSEDAMLADAAGIFAEYFNKHLESLQGAGNNEV